MVLNLWVATQSWSPKNSFWSLALFIIIFLSTFTKSEICREQYYTTDQTRGNLWIPFFSHHIPQIVLRYILVVYGCPVFRSQKHGKLNQNIHGSQNFIRLIFSVSLGLLKKD